MELGSLKKMRAAVPAVLLALVFLPSLFYVFSHFPKTILPDGLMGDGIKYALSIIFLPLGYFYDSMQFRRFLNGASHERISLYVENQLRSALQPTQATALEAIPSGDSRWKRLLFRLVDKDPTLQQLATRIRHNGLRWTTVADIGLIFIPGGLLNGLLGSQIHSYGFVYWGMALIAVGFASTLMIVPIERRHIAYCGEQQLHIRGFLMFDLKADFKMLFKS
jgi:hypothetical protein